ncbi:unnamed protein product [Chrysoparadoxa australica]
MLGICATRFSGVQAGLPRMFAMARGIDGSPALSMKKWFTSNYHYMVPEHDETSKVSPNFTSLLADIKRGVDKLGAGVATPVVLGPVTFCKLVKFASGCQKTQRGELLAKLIPVYTKLIGDIAALGVTEIQIHEPALVHAEAELEPLYAQTYPAILASAGSAAINLVSFFEDVGAANYKWLCSLDAVKILSFDFTRGDNLSLIKSAGFPKGKTLGAGVIDGRSIWKVDPAKTLPLLAELAKLAESIRIQPSANLQFTPWTLSCEKDLLAHPVGPVLSFCEQKLQEVKAVKDAAASGGALDEHAAGWASYRAALGKNQAVANRVAALTEKDFARSESFEARRPKQLKGVQIMPTTTIGSFPQTPGIRKLRTSLKKGLLSRDEYNAAIDQQIAYAIGLQDGLGLDILVHGEAERTDMVEFFAQQMDGMLFSTNGWVQSFGSRCVRPPIFWADIHRPNAMTTREFKVAQDLTTRPVKGMLTGPITILNWSFPRVDISRKEQAFQIGLAIRDEIADLEAAGCTVVQVDEPALREGMPMRPDQKEEYLTWAVDAFRVSTAGASSECQIHTHMCYCEFEDCMDAIDRMDTDVNSIENARSDNATLMAFNGIGYTKGLGPGTYDIHSPVVPPIDFVRTKLKSFLACMPADRLVVNPDCGLKTRTWPESIDALKVMVSDTYGCGVSVICRRTLLPLIPPASCQRQVKHPLPNPRFSSQLPDSGS